MGLDMYLYTNSRKLCQEVNDMEDALEGGLLAKRGIVIQWRKANMIHKWFVDNIQRGNDDCGLYDVLAEDLVKLHDTCKEVLESTRLVDADVVNGKRFENGEWVDNLERGKILEDPTKAIELLPTTDGFFFGSTDYDQWYWWDVQHTQRKLDKLLDCLTPADSPWGVVHPDEPDWLVRFQYSSSW